MALGRGLVPTLPTKACHSDRPLHPSEARRARGVRPIHHATGSLAAPCLRQRVFCQVSTAASPFLSKGYRVSLTASLRFLQVGCRDCASDVAPPSSIEKHCVLPPILYSIRISLCCRFLGHSFYHLESTVDLAPATLHSTCLLK